MRPTREHKPLDERTIALIVEKRADARFADQKVVTTRRKTRQTRAMFLAHVEAYCNGKTRKRLARMDRRHARLTEAS